MYHDNSVFINQRESALEYGRYLETKNKNGFIRFIIKGLIIPAIALLLILGLATFLIANNSPATYAKAKDIVFANVDVEKLTGVPDSIAREQLDSWLVLNPWKQQEKVVVQEQTGQK